MFNFNTIQMLFLYCSALLAFICVCHVTCFKSTPCKNTSILAITLSSGLCYLMVCAYKIEDSQEPFSYLLAHSSSRTECVDITYPTIAANAMLLFSISYGILQNTCNIARKAVWVVVFLMTIIVSPILMKVIDSVLDFPNLFFQPPEILTTVNGPDHVTEIIWMLCKKNISSDKAILMYEYACLYCPVMVMTLYGLIKEYNKSKRFGFKWLKVLNKECSFEVGQRCLCSTFNSSCVIIVQFCFLMLFIFRPFLLVYSHFTSGWHRDELLIITASVSYTFLYIEYLLGLSDLKASCSNTVVVI